MNDDDTVEDVEELLRQARAYGRGEPRADDEETIDVDPRLLQELRAGSAPGSLDDDVTVVADRAGLGAGEPDPVAAGVAHPVSAAPSEGGTRAWRVGGVVVVVLAVFVGGWWAATAFTGGSDTEAGDSAVDGGSVEVPARLPGEGVDVVAGRAVWRTGHFQAELYKQLLEELGFNVSDPGKLQLPPDLAYEALALGEVDYWPNSWYPAHSAYLDNQLRDGSRVGDHVSIVGEEMISGGLRGFLVSKSFADEYGVYTMDELNRNADALAAFDAADSVPDNGVADIFGCPESWHCDDVIDNQIAFSNWHNIAQTKAGYDAMFSEAVHNVTLGIPMVFWTWTPARHITLLRPGDNVYWLGMEKILDDSNPTRWPGGERHSQRGADGSGGFAAIDPAQCPSAADEPSGQCKIGWMAYDILVTANNDFLAENPSARALFEAVRLSMFDVSLANAGREAGAGLTDLAAQWIADNRGLVDGWIAAALAAS